MFRHWQKAHWLGCTLYKPVAQVATATCCKRQALAHNKLRLPRMWRRWRPFSSSRFESFGILTTSSLWTKFGAEGGELQSRAFLEIARAKSDEEAGAAFDKFVADWKAAGGDAATAEMSAVLAQIYK